MSNIPFDIVLFDLDGTLVDSARDLCPAVNHALAEIGRDPVSENTSRGLIGGGTDMMLTRALEATGGMIDDGEYRQLTRALLDFYWDNIAVNTVPYPGCIEALQELQTAGAKLAICTNKSEKPARELLDALEMTHFFPVIYGGDTLGRENAKPAPDMLHAAIADCGGGRAVMVGDTTYDVRAGKSAGLPVVACSFGYCDEPVTKLGADAVISAFAELAPSIRSL
ncbi:HAD-IA family hydrolase [Aurantiacibacter sp. D1-12]|uniref:HAD-IA family hydrolase n=1 Tax=Aurantiacibacter sp. D1-12 TaxID=2993658 RepID=UPI00237D1F96|nr:HAD-IA family hydrolase [Aurantiacibacter sp. D1-12]MDE1466236.1 HAD-IA family hydrolase [Aurantiacibacter sp. D1-12]